MKSTYRTWIAAMAIVAGGAVVGTSVVAVESEDVRAGTTRTAAYFIDPGESCTDVTSSIAKFAKVGHDLTGTEDFGAAQGTWNTTHFDCDGTDMTGDSLYLHRGNVSAQSYGIHGSLAWVTEPVQGEDADLGVGSGAANVDNCYVARIDPSDQYNANKWRVVAAQGDATYKMCMFSASYL